MEQTKSGNIIAFINRDKQPGDKKPAFDGRLSLPGRDEKRSFALWAHEYTDTKTGRSLIMFNGRAAPSTSAAPLDQVAALLNSQGPSAAASYGNLTLAPDDLVLFPNGFKDEDPTKDRPDYWGAFNPGNGEPVVRLSVWAKKDRYGNTILSGETSYPLPGKSERTCKPKHQRTC
jgi:hypothetical protein